jgi:hypothetical protein
LLAEAVKGVWLGHRARQRVKRVPLCMAKLQSYWRMRQQRDTYRRIRDAAVAIQAEVRCFLGRQWFEVARAAAVALQSAFRRKQAQREVRIFDSAAIDWVLLTRRHHDCCEMVTVRGCEGVRGAAAIAASWVQQAV